MMKFNRSIFSNNIYIFISFVTILLLSYFYTLNLGQVGDDFIWLMKGPVWLPEGHGNHNLEKGFYDVLCSGGTRPLTIVTFWIEKKLFAQNPVIMKIISILIHACVGLSIISLIKEIDKRHNLTSPYSGWWTYIISLCFIIHPIHNQAININIQRSTVLVALFVILSFTFFLRFIRLKRSKDYFLSLFLYVLAVISKENSVCLLPIIFIYLTIFKRKQTFYARLIPFVIVTLVPTGLAFYTAINSTWIARASPIEYFLTQLKVILIYLKLFIFPYGLRYMYDVNISRSIFELYTFLAAFFHIILLSIIGFCFKRDKLKAFFFFAVYIALLPESSFVSIYHFAFEHRAYLPVVFMFIGIYLIVRNVRINRVTLSIVMIAIIYLVSFNIIRNRQIENREKFVINMLDNSHYNHEINQHGMYHLFERGNAHGYLVSKRLAEIYPKNDWYKLYLMAFEMQRSTGVEKEKKIEKIANYLISIKVMPKLVRQYLNLMVALELAKIKQGFDFYYLIENLIFTQFKFIEHRDKRLKEVALLYTKCILFLKRHYEVRSRLDGMESQELKQINSKIEKYFKE